MGLSKHLLRESLQYKITLTIVHISFRSRRFIRLSVYRELYGVWLFP
jgi:hypothetical protein